MSKPKLDMPYYCVPKEKWKHALAMAALAPVFARLRLPAAALSDAARAAVDAGRVECEDVGPDDFALRSFDPEDWVEDLKTTKPYLVQAEGTPAETSTKPLPAGWPAGAPAPGSEAFRRAKVEDRLRWSNAQIAFLDAQKKAAKARGSSQ